MIATPDNKASRNPRSKRYGEHDPPEPSKMARYVRRWFRGFHLHRKKPKITDWVTVGLTLGVAFAAIYSACVFQGQLTQARIATQRSTESFQFDERAWVTADVGESIGNFSIGMHNTGKTPALKVTYSAAFTPGPLIKIPDVDFTYNSSKAPPFQLPNNLPPDVLERLKKEGVIGRSAPEGFVIAPNKSEIASYYGGKLSDIMKTDAQRMYIQGDITYEDVFGGKHETQFCYWYAAPNSYPMCNDHNRAN